MEVKVNVQKTALLLSVSEEEVFKRAYRRYGLALSPGGVQSDLAWWKKWGTEPPYVKKFIRDIEKNPPEQYSLFV